jgi:hypothetical protein
VEKYRAIRRATANNTIWLTRIAFWISKAGIQTRTHNINTFPGHEWLNERVSVLRYTYIACFGLVSFSWMPILKILFYNFLNFCLPENKFLQLEVPFVNF